MFGVEDEIKEYYSEKLKRVRKESLRQGLFIGFGIGVILTWTYVLLFIL